MLISVYALARYWEPIAWSNPVNDNSSPPASTADTPGQSRNARLGLILFLVYLLLYGGFIFMSAFARETMARPALGGVNFAIVYGFSLIAGAFVLAMLYMVLCVPEAPDAPDLTEGRISDAALKEEGSA